MAIQDGLPHEEQDPKQKDFEHSCFIHKTKPSIKLIRFSSCLFIRVL